MNMIDAILCLSAIFTIYLACRFSSRAGFEQGYDVGYREATRKHYASRPLPSGVLADQWRESAGMTGLETSGEEDLPAIFAAPGKEDRI